MLTVGWSYRLPLAFRRWLPLKGVTNKKVSAADLHADKFKSALTSSGPPRTRDAANGEAPPVESAAEAAINGKNESQHSLQLNPLAQCSFVTVLTRPDGTVTVGWPTVHEKTSHGPPMERWSLRPAMGYVGLTPIDRTVHTISLQNALEMVVLTPQGASGTCGQLPGTGTDAYALRIAPLYVSLLP